MGAPWRYGGGRAEHRCKLLPTAARSSDLWTSEMLNGLGVRSLNCAVPRTTSSSTPEGLVKGARLHFARRLRR
eukprot:13918313-Alexandrium_andersonii.AAC.1